MRDVVVLLSKHIDRFVKSHFPDYEEVPKCSLVAYLVCRVVSCLFLCYLVLFVSVLAFDIVRGHHEGLKTSPLLPQLFMYNAMKNTEKVASLVL
jgi:hypothetical protein